MNALLLEAQPSSGYVHFHLTQLNHRILKPKATLRQHHVPTPSFHRWGRKEHRLAVNVTQLLSNEACTRSKGSTTPMTAFSWPYHATPSGVCTFTWETKKQVRAKSKASLWGRSSRKKCRRYRKKKKIDGTRQCAVEPWTDLLNTDLKRVALPQLALTQLLWSGDQKYPY